MSGAVRRPQGSGMPTAVPSDTYRAKDGQWLVIAGNSDPIFARLCRLMGRPDMAEDPRLKTNVGRLDDAGEKGAIAWPGPAVGAHNDEVYAGLLGFPAEEVRMLRDAKAI